MKEMDRAVSWREIKPAGIIDEPGNSADFYTGNWRNEKPDWILDKCTQCMLCYPVCPDCAIPLAKDGRGEYNYFHCKGCGICSRVCPFGAIVMLPQM